MVSQPLLKIKVNIYDADNVELMLLLNEDERLN